MTIYPKIIAASTALLLTACAVTAPNLHDQKSDQTDIPTQTRAELQTRQYVQYNSPRKTIAPTQLNPPAILKAADYRTQPQPTLIRTATQMQKNLKPVYLNTYTVQEGDTVYNLGRQFCSRAEDIKLYNGLDTKYSLQIGQSIVLPRTTC